MRQHESELEGLLADATGAKFRAENEAAESAAASEVLRQQLEATSAERRVLQENVSSMRQECTERWVRGIQWSGLRNTWPSMALGSEIGFERDLRPR